MQSTNALQSALINAGVAQPITQMEQIWNVVKQDQPCDYTHIAKRTGISQSSVSSILCTMEKRDMVFSRGAKGKGPYGSRKEYSTLLTQYRRLPTPESIGINIDKAHRANVTPVTTSEKPKVVVHLTRKTVDLDQLTIGEARALYLKLKEMFE